MKRLAFCLLLILAPLILAVTVKAADCGLVESNAANPDSETFALLKYYFTEGKTNVLHWKNKQAKYWINKLQAPGPVANPVGEIKAAANLWSSASWGGKDDFDFLYQGTTDKWPHPGNPPDGKSVVGWQAYERQNGQRPLGVTLIKKLEFLSSTRIKEVDTTLNSYYDWDDQPYPGRFDVQSVALHEFGHWLRLADLAEDNLPPGESNKLPWYQGGCDEFINTVMYYKVEWYGAFWRSLTWIDQWGKWYIYSSGQVSMAPPISSLPSQCCDEFPPSEAQYGKAVDLFPAFPQPANPELWLPYQLHAEAEVVIHIYDVRGTLVKRLELGVKPAGDYLTKASAAYWNGRNDEGERVASGVYFYTLETGREALSGRVVIER